MIDFAEELRAAINSVDPRLHQLFDGVINSFIRLELIVLMRRNSDRDLAPSAISSELGWPEDRVREEMAFLKQSGIVEECQTKEGGYHLSRDPQISDLLNKFGFLYANRSSRLLILGHLLRQSGKSHR